MRVGIEEELTWSQLSYIILLSSRQNFKGPCKELTWRCPGRTSMWTLTS